MSCSSCCCGSKSALNRKSNKDKSKQPTIQPKDKIKQKKSSKLKYVYCIFPL